MIFIAKTREKRANWMNLNVTQYVKFAVPNVNQYELLALNF